MQWDLEAMISLLLSRAPKPELGSRPLLALLAGLFVLFLWYCYRIGTEDQEPDSSSSRRTRGRIKALGVSGAMGGEVGLGIIGITPSEHGYFSPISSGHPFQDLDQVSPGRRKLYRSLQDYAKRYSWSGMGRVHKGVREQARYLSDRLSIQKPKLFYLPDVPSMPYFTRDAQRHDIEVLEASFPAILAEFEVVYQRGLEGKLGWTSGGTQAKGVWVPQNCRSCPRTYRVLSSLRTFINGNIFGNAGFSLLQPGTSLPGTYGPTNTRLRCHLGLKVPTGCELVVGGEPQCWSEGYCLLVDDSFLHTTAHNAMEEDQEDRPELFPFRGIHMVSYFTDNWDQVEAFQARPDDVIVASYPKTGTTWVSQIVDLMYCLNDPSRVHRAPIYERVPFLEMSKTEDFEAGGLKPASGQIIYTARNAKDTAVSYFHFCRMNKIQSRAGTWPNFLEEFINGEMVFGPWYDHVRGWWDKKESHPILYLLYEDLKENLSREVDKICRFLGRELSVADKQKLVSQTSFDVMKSTPMANYSTCSAMNHKVSPFMRKGQVGDWKNHFTVAQNERFDEDYKRKMEGTTLTFRTEI
ncbi:ST2S2 sulfotransferase, partial [Polypterus senegalus]